LEVIELASLEDILEHYHPHLFSSTLF